MYVLNCNCKCYLVIGRTTHVLTSPLGSDVSGPAVQRVNGDIRVRFAI